AAVGYHLYRSNQQLIGDFTRMKELLRVYGDESRTQSKRLEIVCINLDSSPPVAGTSLSSGPGIQLFQPGGLESSLANQYGIVVLPTMFLVGSDGKVVNRNIQIATVEEEIKKLVK